MNKANEMKVDQTNALLSQVEGLNFKIPGLSEDKQPGAAPKSSGVDPESLMVEDTNDKLSSIMGPAWDSMNKGSKKEAAKPLTEAVVSMGALNVSNPILPSRTAGVTNHMETLPVAPAKLENTELNDEVAAVNAARGLIEQAAAALNGVAGMEDICEELQEIGTDLKEAIEDEE